MKVWLSLAVFFSVICIGRILPTYGQEKRLQSPRHEERSEPNQPVPQSPPPTTNVVNLQAAPEQENQAKGRAGYLKRLFSPENISNIALFFVGFGGIIVAIRTLRAIERQTKATQDSADVQWASQRAQIVIEPHGNPANDLMGDTPRVLVEMFNKGGTPGYDLIYETWIELVGPPFEDFTSAATYFKSPQRRTAYPNSAPVVINIPFGREFTELEKSQVRSWKKQVWVRIRAEFKDARKEPRYSEFGFHVMYEGLGTLSKYQEAN